jgi:hypothetical protein
MTTKDTQPKTGQPCHCKRGQQRDNCPDCEGTGMRIDFAALRARRIIKTRELGLMFVADLEDCGLDTEGRRL